MENSTLACGGDSAGANGVCTLHYHAQDPIFTGNNSDPSSQTQLLKQRNGSSPARRASSSSANREAGAVDSRTKVQKKEVEQIDCDPSDRGFRRIVRNFTPSYVSIYTFNECDRDALYLLACLLECYATAG